MTATDPNFAQDQQRRAEEIAQFLYGDRELLRRKVYHLVATSNFPIFKLGSMICAHKSELLSWIRDQEAQHNNNNESKHA